MAFFKIELKTPRLCFKMGYALLVAGVYISIKCSLSLSLIELIIPYVIHLFPLCLCLLYLTKRDGKCFALVFFYYVRHDFVIFIKDYCLNYV